MVTGIAEKRLRNTVSISLIAAPVGEVMTPIVLGRAGGFVYLQYRTGLLQTVLALTLQMLFVKHRPRFFNMFDDKLEVTSGLVQAHLRFNDHLFTIFRLKCQPALLSLNIAQRT